MAVVFRSLRTLRSLAPMCHQLQRECTRPVMTSMYHIAHRKMHQSSAPQLITSHLVDTISEKIANEQHPSIEQFNSFLSAMQLQYPQGVPFAIKSPRKIRGMNTLEVLGEKYVREYRSVTTISK